MTKYKIHKSLETEIKKELGEEIEWEIKYITVLKNNGCKYMSLTIMKPGQMVSPTIYIDEILDQLDKQEITMRDAAQKIVSLYKAGMDGMEEMEDVMSVLSRDFILETVVYQLINAEMNAELLANMPHKKFLDFAVIYKVAIGDNATTRLNNSICSYYSISEVELDAAARRNTEKRGFHVCSLLSMLPEMVRASVEEEAKMVPSDMYVLTSSSKIDGAAVMLYASYFEKLAADLGTDLYILPSSIHELIALPAVDGRQSVDDLKEMVREVNDTQVAPEEVLGENIYLFRRERGGFEIA